MCPYSNESDEDDLFENEDQTNLSHKDVYSRYYIFDIKFVEPFSFEDTFPYMSYNIIQLNGKKKYVITKEDFLKLNQSDLMKLIRWTKSKRHILITIDVAYKRLKVWAAETLRVYETINCELSEMIFKRSPGEPTYNVPNLKQYQINIPICSPVRGVAYMGKYGHKYFFHFNEKHLFSIPFLNGMIAILKGSGKKNESILSPRQNFIK